MLGFSGDNAILEATWAKPGGGKVPWEFFPADEWDPNTGDQVAKGSWNPLKGSDGTAELALSSSLMSSSLTGTRRVVGCA